MALRPRLRRSTALALSVGLVIVACSSSDDDTAPTTSAPADAAPTTVEAPASTTSIPDEEPSADDVPAPTLDELRLAALDGGPEALQTYALTRFANEYGQVDGALERITPSADPTSGSQTLHEIEEVWNDLEPEQQTQIAERFEAFRASATLLFDAEEIGDPVDYGPPLDLTSDPTAPGDDSGVADGASAPDTNSADEPQGFAPQPLRAPLLGTVDEDEAERIARDATSFLVSRLGGTIRYDFYVAPASEATGPGVDGATNTTVFAPGGTIEDLIDLTGRPDCEIYIYDRPRLTGPRLRSVIAHELFHCWTYMNSPTTADHGLLVPWFSEGVATWVGEQYAGGSSFGAVWWPAYFDLDVFPLYRTEYRALGFWTQVAQAIGGADALWRRIPALTVAAAQGDAGTYATAMRDVSLQDWAGLASNGARQPSWGPEWTLDGVGISGDSRPITPQAVTGETPVPYVAGPGEQLIVRFDIDPLLVDGPTLLTAEVDGLVNMRWGDDTTMTSTAAGTMEWCLDGPCVCPDGTELRPGLEDAPDDQVWTAITGGTRTDSSAAFSITTIDDDTCEEEPPPTLPEADDSILVGTWRANPEAVARLFEEASVFGGGSNPIDVAGVTGDLLLTFDEGGTGTLTWNDVTLFLNDEVIGDLTIFGSGSFTWGGRSPDIQISGTTFSLSVTTTALGGTPLTITDADVPTSGTTTLTASIAGPTLVIADATGSAGTVFFPAIWTKQG